MTNLVSLEMSYYFDPTRSRSVGLGKVFIGEPDLDPQVEANRKTVTLIQEDGTETEILPSAQPITLNAGGGATLNGSPVRVFVEGNYSQKVLDRNDDQIYYIENVFAQPVTSENRQVVDLTITIGTLSFPTAATGFTIETNHYDSVLTVDSGGQFAYTGLTIPAKSGNVPDADGFFYDSDGRQLEIEVIRVDSFGARPYDTRAAAIAGDNSSPAITAALATGRPLTFNVGFYGVIAGFVMGLRQYARGQGYASHDLVLDGAGTRLVRQSGTDIMWDFNNSDSYLSDIALDANDLDGNLIRHDGSKYCTIERVSFHNQGANSYSFQNVPYDAGLHVSTTNLLVCNRLIFDPNPTSGGHINLTGRMLYAAFTNVVMGDVGNSGYGIIAGDPDANGFCSQVSFRDVQSDSPILLGNGISPVQSMNFDSLKGEPGFDRIHVLIDGSQVTQTTINDYRINVSSFEHTEPYIAVRDGALNTTLSQLVFGDSFTGGSKRTAIELDGADEVQIKGAKSFSIDDHFLVEMMGTTSTHVLMESIHYWINNNAEIICKAEDAILIGGNVPISFTAGNVRFTNVGSVAAITLANVGEYFSTLDLGTDADSYTGTITGGTTAPTGTIDLKRVGNTVTISVPGFTFTSNSTTATVTGMTPSSIFPKATHYIVGAIASNGNNFVAVTITINDSGVINLFASISQAVFDATNTVATLPFTSTYIIADT